MLLERICTTNLYNIAGGQQDKATHVEVRQPTEENVKILGAWSSSAQYRCEETGMAILSDVTLYQIYSTIACWSRAPR